jgi:hypothetical protein
MICVPKSDSRFDSEERRTDMILPIFCKIGEMVPNISLSNRKTMPMSSRYLKENEMAGGESVHLVFANSPHEGPQT